MELTEGAVVAERFRLVRLLGQGGMGEVWTAQHMSLDIPCAVKFIHAESAEKEDVRSRFEREAKAAAALRSPNVVQILDYGVWENTPYIAMEYLEGEPLNARLRRRGTLDPHETFRIVAGVAKALTKAHQAGIVHRDLKPENIFLVPDDDVEIAKVLDFGVAKQTTTLDSNTRTGALLGTPYYMSPEQAQGTRAVDFRADLWSLAVVAFRCITGELPFKSEALGDLLIKIVTAPAPVPSHVARVPDGFDAWWNRASQRDPDHRFQTAKEFTQGLGLALNVSMQASFGQTPMPGGMGSRVSQVVGNNMAGNATMAPDSSSGTALPFQTGPGAMGGHTPQPNMYSAGGALGDSGTSQSVAGMATATAAGSSSGKLVAIFGALVVVLAVVGVGGFMVLKNEKPTDSASGSASVEHTAASTAATASAEVRVQATASASEAPPDVSASATASATAVATVAPIRTTRVGSGPAPVNTPTAPTPPPPPPPPEPVKPPPPTSGGFDPGF